MSTLPILLIWKQHASKNVPRFKAFPQGDRKPATIYVLPFHKNCTLQIFLTYLWDNISRLFENIKFGGCWTWWHWLCMCKMLLGALWILSLWILWILWILWLWILWILWLWWLCLCKRLLGGGRPLKSLAAILRCRDDKEIVKINQHRYREDQKEEKKIFLLRSPLLLPGWWTDRGDGERDRFHQREHNTTKTTHTSEAAHTRKNRSEGTKQNTTQSAISFLTLCYLHPEASFKIKSLYEERPTF